MFAIQRDNEYSKGFSIKFSNGYTLSVKFGSMNYCAARKCAPYTSPDMCRDAEIAVIRPDGEFHSLDNSDDVMGWVTPDKLAELIPMIAGL